MAKQVIKDLKKTYSTIRTLIEQDDLETAEQLCDEMLLHLAIKSSEGLKELQGVSIDLWKHRVWIEIENAGLLND
jgi:hypothetical protein